MCTNILSFVISTYIHVYKYPNNRQVYVRTKIYSGEFKYNIISKYIYV